MSIKNIFQEADELIPMNEQVWNLLARSDPTTLNTNTILQINNVGEFTSINTHFTTLNAPQVLFNSDSLIVVPNTNNTNAFQVLSTTDVSIFNVNTIVPSVSIGGVNITLTGASGTITDVDLLDTLNIPTDMTTGNILVATASGTFNSCEHYTGTVSLTTSSGKATISVADNGSILLQPDITSFGTYNYGPFFALDSSNYSNMLIDTVFHKVVLGSASVNVDIFPNNDMQASCGVNGNAWLNVYSYGYPSPSDIRIKDNIKDNKLGLKFLNKVKTKQYTYKNGDDKRIRYGMIFQEIEKLIKEDSGLLVKGEVNCLNYIEFIPIIIKSIQQLSKIVNKLEEELMIMNCKMNI